jgi:hypothetical protein
MALGKRYWDDFHGLSEGSRERKERENVGAPTFKVTLEGNYSLNTGTA